MEGEALFVVADSHDMRWGCIHQAADTASELPNHNSGVEGAFAYHPLCWYWWTAGEEAGGSWYGWRESRWVEEAVGGGCIDAWLAAADSSADAGGGSGRPLCGPCPAGWLGKGLLLVTAVYMENLSRLRE